MWRLVHKKRGAEGGQRSRKGFSLIELLMVIAVIGILSGIAVPVYDSYREKVRVAAAILGIGVIARDITAYFTTTGTYPATLADIGQNNVLDPWGHPYQYLRIAGADPVSEGSGGSQGGKGGSKSSATQDNSAQSKARKDHFMVPINTDFDLYSMGKDGQSVAPLTAKASRDDIIRANDGQFIGLASEF